MMKEGRSIQTLGGNQSVTVVTEADIYSSDPSEPQGGSALIGAEVARVWWFLFLLLAYFMMARAIRRAKADCERERKAWGE